MVPDNSEELQYRQNQMETVRRQDERRVQRVTSDTSIDEFISDTKLRSEQRKSQALEAEVARLKKENDALKVVATHIMIDRRAIANTIAYLADKWADMEVKAPGDKGPVVLPDEAEKVRKQEGKRLRETDNYIEESIRVIENHAEDRIKKYMS